MKKILLLAAFLILALAVPAQAQDQPKVTTDNSVCEHFKATVVNLPPGSMIRFQLGHDLVKIVEVSEQDTAAAFDSGAFPASDWGFEVRLINGENDQTIFNKIVTVKPCSNTLPFTGMPTHFWLALGGLFLALGVAILVFLRIKPHAQ